MIGCISYDIFLCVWVCMKMILTNEQIIIIT